jgi:hypothetical protein
MIEWVSTCLSSFAPHLPAGIFSPSKRGEERLPQRRNSPSPRLRGEGWGEGQAEEWTAS